MKNSTSVQKSGWIVWWITTVIFIFAVIGIALLLLGVPNYHYAPNEKMILIIAVIGMAIFFICEQVLAFFMIKYLHRDNSYIYPIILIVLAFFGSSLYFIPGIWGVLYANHQKLTQS